MLVIEAGSARRAAIKRSLRRLLDADASVVGAILTKFQPKTGTDHEHYGYGYGYGYGTDQSRRGLFGRLRPRGRDQGKTLDVGA